QVRHFVAKHTRFPLRDISSETRMVSDIGVAGEKAEKFFAAFAEQFDVDPDSLRHIDFRKHFGHEGEFSRQQIRSGRTRSTLIANHRNSSLASHTETPLLWFPHPFEQTDPVRSRDRVFATANRRAGDSFLASAPRSHHESAALELPLESAR